MNVLVDTSVWSLAFRRRRQDLDPGETRFRDELKELIREGRAQLIGVVRQELLSGIRVESQFSILSRDLRAFDDPAPSLEEYEEAARIANACRQKGVAGSTVDFLICSIALNRNWQIFTTDSDFEGYAKVVPLRLYSPRS